VSLRRKEQPLEVARLPGEAAKVDRHGVRASARANGYPTVRIKPPLATSRYQQSPDSVIVGRVVNGTGSIWANRKLLPILNTFPEDRVDAIVASRTLSDA
jgi:hypothetical protein